MVVAVFVFMIFRKLSNSSDTAKSVHNSSFFLFFVWKYRNLFLFLQSKGEWLQLKQPRSLNVNELKIKTNVLIIKGLYCALGKFGVERGGDNEECIILSHALFGTMTQPQFFKGKIRKENFFLLLRQYEEEMLPTILGASHLKTNKDARKLAAIALVAAGYAGDMDEELANELTSLTSVATRQILS